MTLHTLLQSDNQRGPEQLSSYIIILYFSLIKMNAVYILFLGLAKFPSCSCRLERLDISWCQDVSDEGVRTVLGGCPYLRHLG